MVGASPSQVYREQTEERTLYESEVATLEEGEGSDPLAALLTLSLCLLPLRLLFPERLQLNRAFETTPQGVCLSLCRGSA